MAALIHARLDPETERQLARLEAVIAEACYLLRDVRGAPDAILENVERGVFQIPLRLDASARALRARMKRYANVPMDLADACLVHLADGLGTGRILTLDREFGAYRWRPRQPFEILGLRLA